MIIGQTIVAVDVSAGGSATTVLTPWIATFGNSAIFPYEIMAIGGATPSLQVRVYTKNTEEADPGTPKGTANVQTTAGTYSITDATGLLELVRLEFILSATQQDGCCTAFAHLRPLNPSWKTN